MDPCRPTIFISWRRSEGWIGGQAMVSSPLAFTSTSSLRDGPLGRLAPRSQSLTSLAATLRWRAKTA